MSLVAHSGLVRWITGLIALIGTAGIVLAISLLTAGRAAAEPPLTDCTTSGIQAALSAGGMVSFNCLGGSVTIPITATLVVTSNVTLDGGNQVTLDGQGARRIISVSAGVGFTLTNIVLQNGSGGVQSGGAVFAGPGSSLFISGTTMVSNTSFLAGGIFGDRVTLVGSTLLANTGFLGAGGVGAYQLIIERSTLALNSAPLGNGGGAALANYLTATGATVLSNSADGGGGGLNAIFRARVIDSLIQNNRSISWSGGGIWTSEATVSGTTFISNSAGTFGGGVFASSVATVTGAQFVSNTALFGGGINVDRLLVTDTSFISNTATAGSGGGAHTNTLIASAVTVLSNTAAPGNGAGLAAIQAATVEGSTFRGNVATFRGGGLWGGVATVGASTFLNNLAAEGGGIGVDTRAIVSRSTITANQAITQGGGIAALVGVVLTDTIVANNVAEFSGGVSGGAGLTVTRSTIAGNLANSQFGTGGLSAVRATIEDSTILSNTGGLGGGAFAFEMTVGRSTLAGNRVMTSTGGAITGQNVRLTNATLTGNSGALGGGAVSFFGSLVMTNATVMDNGSYAITSTASTLPFTLVNSLLGSPGSPICAYPATFIGGNLIEDASCGGTASAPLLLGPLQDNGGPTWTRAPLPGSPVIGAFSPCRVAVDQRGAIRGSPECHPGAYESGAAPLLNSLSPPTATALDPGFVLTIVGSGFLPGTVALWNGVAQPTIVVRATALTLTVPASEIAVGRVVTVQARYGAGLDSLSNVLPFTVTMRGQAISFAPLPDRTVVETPFTISATASSGLSVSFSASGVCAVSGTTVTLIGVGSCTITASQPGNAAYLPAPPVERTFTVSDSPPQATGKVITLPAVGKDRPFG